MMSMKYLRVAILGLIAAAANAAAQTRTDEIEAAREKKVQTLQEENVSGLENLMLQFKQRKVMERMTAGYNGLRAQIGSLATGSGFAAGPEFFREDFLDGQLRVNASAIISTRLWQKFQASITAPHLAGDHLLLKLEAAKRDYRSLEFYGIGIDSSRLNRTDYRLWDTSLEGSAGVRMARYIRFGGTLGGMWTNIRPGERDDLPNTDVFFDDLSAPGLLHQANFLRGSIFGQIDYRDDPAGPKSGGNYVSEYTWYHDRSLDRFSFDRLDVDLQQYIPFFNKSRRFALRVRMTMTDADAGQRMPFYLQPYLGGADDLRGFKPYRFTAPNAVVYNAEYRWEIFSGLDGALFFDAGKVMPRWGHLGMSDMEVSPGFGLRFNARNQTFIRLDVGFSHEGTCIWLKFNDPFIPLLFGAGVRQPLY
jgi:outer membrane protein assembly factor BamA